MTFNAQLIAFFDRVYVESYNSDFLFATAADFLGMPESYRTGRNDRVDNFAGHAVVPHLQFHTAGFFVCN
jgi:hypothetical protein